MALLDQVPVLAVRGTLGLLSHLQLMMTVIGLEKDETGQS